MSTSFQKLLFAILFLFVGVILVIYFATTSLGLNKGLDYYHVQCKSTWYISEFKDTLLLDYFVRRKDFYQTKDSLVQISPMNGDEEFKPFIISKREADIFFNK
jgi:hypothetical protein